MLREKTKLTKKLEKFFKKTRCFNVFGINFTSFSLQPICTLNIFSEKSIRLFQIG